MFLARVVAEGRQGWFCAQRFEQTRQFARRVVIERHDGAERGGAGAHQLEAVILGLAQGALMRQNYSGVPWLQPHACQQAGARVALAAAGEPLLIEVKRWIVLLEYARAPPFGKGGRRARIAVVEVVVARLIASQFQADDVVRIALVVACLRLRRDDIIGRGDERGQMRRVGVTYSRKRPHVGHDKSPVFCMLAHA